MPIVKTEAAKGEGVAELAEKIAEHRAHIEAEGTLEERRARNLRNEVLELAAARLRRRLEAAAEDPAIAELLERVVAASSTPPAPRPSCWSARMAESAKATKKPAAKPKSGQT